MRLRSRERKLGITVTSFWVLLSLAACNKQTGDDVSDAISVNSIQDSDAIAEDANEVGANPCLDSMVIWAMKEKIIDGAINNVENNYASDTVDPSVLHNTEINFDYITQPTSTNSGGWSCGAQANVNYISNYSDNDLMVKVSQIMKSDYSRALPDMGINSYNIDNFQDISGNSFSTPIEYEINTTYSESGEAQQSWRASIVDISNMLALIVVAEDRMQRNRDWENRNTTNQEDEAVENISYQDQLAAEREQQQIDGATRADSYYEDRFIEDGEQGVPNEDIR